MIFDYIIEKCCYQGLTRMLCPYRRERKWCSKLKNTHCAILISISVMNSRKIKNLFGIEFEKILPWANILFWFQINVYRTTLILNDIALWLFNKANPLPPYSYSEFTQRIFFKQNLTTLTSNRKADYIRFRQANGMRGLLKCLGFLNPARNC